MNNKTNFAQLFTNGSNIFVMHVSCLQFIQYFFKQCSECSAAAAIHDWSLLQSDTTALTSMNSYWQSFYIINKSLSAQQHWIDLTCVHSNLLAYQSGAFSVIFTSGSQFNYLFT